MKTVRAGGHATHMPPARVRTSDAVSVAARLRLHVRANDPRGGRLLCVDGPSVLTHLDRHTQRASWPSTHQTLAICWLSNRGVP